MALVLLDRVQQTGTANTTVSFTVTGSVAGYQSWSAVGNGNTTYYGASDASGNWETGLATYSTTGPTVTRTTIFASSNAGAAVTFSGTVNVWVDYPASKSVNLDASGNVSALGTITSGTWNAGVIPVAYGGTNSTATPTAGSVHYGTGTAWAATAAGTTGQSLLSQGAGTPVWGSSVVSGTAVASTSGTSIDFTSIPSWVKRITVMFQGVSTNGTSVVQIQLGAGSVTTSGYLGAASAYAGGATGSVANFTTGFGVGNFNSASNVRHGALILNNISGNIWSCNGTITLSDSSGAGSSAGTISLGGTLDRVRITTVNGTDTFDAGSINILYE